MYGPRLKHSALPQSAKIWVGEVTIQDVPTEAQAEIHPPSDLNAGPVLDF
jgi:hypothetical protein